MKQLASLDAEIVLPIEETSVSDGVFSADVILDLLLCSVVVVTFLVFVWLAIRSICRGYVITYGLVTFIYAILIWLVVNLLSSEYGTDSLFNELVSFVNSFVIPVLFLFALVLIIIGAYKLERHRRESDSTGDL